MFYFVARSDGLCIDNILRNTCLGMRKNAKRAKVLIEAERLSFNIDFLRNLHVLKKTIEWVFGDHWSVNFLTTHSQRLDNALSRS